MRVVLQRVAWAAVAVDGDEIARIGPGLLALVGVADGDDAAAAERLARKTVRLRLFGDEERGFERSLLDTGGELLCVSQFTLHGDVRRGNRPSWSAAAPPERAAPLVDAYADHVAAEGVAVARGRFGAMMAVSLVNDGPVTLILDSRDFDIPRRAA
ncbi:MAG: D-aminoacyl-tRNA deacylase [Actinomycetota bacterium]